MDEEFDFGDAIDKFREMFSGEEGKKQLLDLLEMFSGEKTEKTETEAENGFDFDPTMLLKIQKILSAANTSAPDDRARLLLSLKPFLGDNRQSKVDGAIKIMKMSKILSALRDE